MQREDQLHRTLKQRHLSMIAMGGAIGTGLFFASGNAISDAGPGGAMLAYAVMGTLVYFLMTGLGEMATLIPLSGSFETYASKFVDPALGFAMGWNYYLSWAITVTFEIVVGTKILQYWIPDAPTWIPSMIFLVILFLLNVFSARVYGEAEFWFASIKVITIIVFLIAGFLMIFGLLGEHETGLANWTLFDSQSGKRAPFTGGAFILLYTFLIAGFSFQGTELIGLSAGESERPDKDIPKAIKSVFWRIVLFYMGSIFVISTLVPFTDEHLLSYGAEEIAYSPFTLIFFKSGMSFAADFMNLIVLTSVLSCGNSGLYCTVRMLYAMGKEGKAPKLFAKTNRRGVPMPALLLTTGIAFVGFIISLIPEINVYDFLINTASLTGFFAWFCIALCHWRFRRAYVKQGYRVEDLKYKAKLYPLGPIAGIILCLCVIFGSNMWIFFDFDWFTFISNYITIPGFLAIYLGYKFVMKTKIIPLEECDFSQEYKQYKKDE